MVGCLLPLALQSCGSAYCFFDPLIRHRYGIDDRATQLFGKLCRIYRISFFIVYIAFVKSHYHGYPQFQKLCGKEKAPAEVRGIHYVDDGIGMLVLYIAACYALLRSERRHGICSRQIHRYDLLAAFVVCLLYRTFFSVHRHAGPVSDLFVPSRQRIIHGGLAAVGISCQCYTHFVPSSVIFGSSLSCDLRSVSQLRARDLCYILRPLWILQGFFFCRLR